MGIASKGLLLLGLLVGLTADVSAQGPIRRTTKRPAGQKRQSILRPQGGQQKAQRPQNRKSQGRPNQNQPNSFERLLRMGPAQRKQFFASERFKRLAPVRQQEIRRRLGRFDALPARQKKLQLERYQLFRNLPQEKQARARRAYAAWSKLPDGTRETLLGDIEALRGMSAQERRTYVAENSLEGKYSQQEIRVLREMVSINTPTTTGRDESVVGK